MSLTRLVRRRAPAGAALWSGRILGAAGLAKAVALWPVLSTLADPSALRMPIVRLPLDGGVAYGLLILWVAASVLLTIGRRRGEAATVLAMLAGYLLSADHQLYSNHLYLLGLLYGLVALAEWGRSGARIPYWPVFLLRVQVSIVYGFAALAKLQPEYLGGEVLAASLLGGPMPPSWLVPIVMAPLAVGSVVVEAFLALGLWSPRLRGMAAATGCMFHTVIVVVMVPTWELLAFGLALVSLYPLAWVMPEQREAETPLIPAT